MFCKYKQFWLLFTILVLLGKLLATRVYLAILILSPALPYDILRGSYQRNVLSITL